MSACETAVTEMIAYVSQVAEDRDNAAFISPHYAINVLRGYKQMEDDNRMIDLSEHGTDTAQAYAYFRSPEWNRDAFLAEWERQQTTHVTV